jgi:hypothetical protein
MVDIFHGYSTYRSFDAYGGIVLSNAVERVVFENKYSDRAIGTRVFRGPAIDLVGENVRISLILTPLSFSMVEHP